MGEKLYSQIARQAISDKITVFFAGSDPLNQDFEILMAWLDERQIECLRVDLEQDSELSSLIANVPPSTSLPILCVDGRIVATGTLLRTLLESGQLEAQLGHQMETTLPILAVTEKALSVWRTALRSPTDVIRLSITSHFEHSLCVDSEQSEDLKLSLGNVIVVLDQRSASRANGLAIDWIAAENATGFRIDNPNETPRVREVDCHHLEQILNEPCMPLLIDVRTDEEFQEQRLPHSRHLNAELIDTLPLLNRQIPLLFCCDNGRRSRRAAQHYVELGFTDVGTLLGGINAWKMHLAKSQSIG